MLLTRIVWKRIIVFLFIAIVGLAPAAATAAESDPDSGLPVQSDSDAEAQDLELVAEAKGWTIAEARADRRAADVIGEIATRVAAEHPEIFVGSKLSKDPGGRPTLYVKGRANALVRKEISAAPIAIELADRQPFSFEELEERKMRVHRRLEELGFDTVVTGFKLGERGLIRAGVVRQAGLPDTAAAVLEELPRDLVVLPEQAKGQPNRMAGVVLIVNDEQIVEDEHSFGGNWVRDDGVNECTSGWAVVNGAGTTGVTTAGHCNGINQIVEPGVGVWALTHQLEHRGQWGDVEWKTSPHIEPAQFYANATTIRNVNSVEARAAISEDESICQYGRSSNDRDCSLDVDQVSQACTNSGVWNNRLVLMDGDTGIGGDSGGGWSWGTRAYGGHKGNCADVPGQEVFSVADLFDEAIGVTVRTN